MSQKAKSQKHTVITMTLPPTSHEKRILPFTEMVIAMPADAGKAVVYDRQPNESVQRISALCGAAIRAAKRRHADKLFAMRPVKHKALETYAVWRLK